MATVTISDLVDYLDQYDPNTPLVLGDPSRYREETLPEQFVSIEVAMYELGAVPAD